MRTLLYTALLSYVLPASATVVSTNFTNAAASGNSALGSSAAFALGPSIITITAGILSPQGARSPTATVTLAPAVSNHVELNNQTGFMGLGNCNNQCGLPPGVGQSTSEIDYNTVPFSSQELLRIDLTDAESKGLTNFAIQTDATTGGSKLGIYGTNVSGTLGTSLADIDDADGLVVVPDAGNYTYLNVISDVDTGNAQDGNGTGLLYQISGVAIPEPNMNWLFLSPGLLVIGLKARRGGVFSLAASSVAASSVSTSSGVKPSLSEAFSTQSM